MKAVSKFLNSLKSEFLHVEWPKMGEVYSLTLTVGFLCVVMGAYLGLFDFLIGRILIRIGIYSVYGVFHV